VSGKPLAGQTALITGAARRLGRAMALALADEGVNVVVHYNTSAAEAEQLCQQLAGRGVNACSVRADLAAADQHEPLIEKAQQAAGSLDILINNASIFPPGTLEDITFDDVAANLQVNAWAPFALSRAFARQAGRGKIVNLLDSKLTRYDWAHAAYYLSKHMLAVIARMTALEFAPDITVNAVAPGLILPPPGEDESYLERMGHMLPLKRHGSPSDVAEAALFLLRSDFITGQVIFVDGGAHLRELADG
jgi:NAD(P)-dependent dehydrogenase (short-subunit alcohol dehydrogenase family)